MYLPLVWSLCAIFLSHFPQVTAVDVASRWGQASVVVNGNLFIYGGKVDEFNSFGYTSAPNSNEILYLSLTQSFSTDSPPWEVVSTPTNTSTSQGPALAWHTLSAFNNSGVLLFGGLPGPNSPTVILDRNDSALLLDVFSRINPTWITDSPSWSNQPVRRIRHSAATSPDGFIFIFGGQKPDGSGIAFSDHFVFNPNDFTFTLLPTNGAAPDLWGHVSIILADGRILIFGGFSPSHGGLLPLSTIWVFDTKTGEWDTVVLQTTDLPAPRQAFAATLINGGKIIIHGGTDAAFQNNFDDGWMLDTTTNPWTWSRISGLSQLGGRRDHFAVSSGDHVIFGFGYNNNSPAPAPPQVFDPSSGSFVPVYNPPPGQFTQTLPQPSATPTRTPTFPTSNTPSPTSPPSNPGGNDNNANDDESKKRTTAIAVGTAFGILGLIAVGVAVYYVRKRHVAHAGDRRFMVLGDEEDDSPHAAVGGRIPAVRMHSLDSNPHHGILSSLGFAGALNAASRRHYNAPARRDMLADEDTRSFGEWYNNRKRDGTGGSSWSLRSILGGGRLRSREGSTAGHSTDMPTPWREKQDPFSDGAALMKDDETGFIGAAAVGPAGTRPTYRREMSYASSRSGYSYRDPFADPIQEEERDIFDASDLYSDEGHSARPSIRPVPAPLRTVVPLAQFAPHPLSPLSEHTSKSTLIHDSSSSQGHSNDLALSPFDSNSMSRGTSLTSNEPTPPAPPGSPTPGSSTSIIGAGAGSLLSNSQPMRRSNSWWARFSRTNLLDRRSSAGRRGATGFEIRDPNPPPRLGAIEERSVISSATPDKNSPQGSSPGSAGVDKQLGSGASKHSPQQANTSRSNSLRIYGGGGHGKSMSSLRTADSEAIERMAGTMDVVQRAKSRSHRGTGSTSSAGHGSMETTGGSVSEIGERGYDGGSITDAGVADEDLIMFNSPLEQSAHVSNPLDATAFDRPGTSQLAHTISPPSTPHRPHSDPTTQGHVSDKVKDYERRMSLGQVSPPPTNTKQKEERSKKRISVDYGLVPRQSLFVANPDRRTGSNDS